MTELAMYAEDQALGYDEVVSRYANMVRRIAFHLMGRLPPSVQADDLIQAGMLGLLEASRNYDSAKGTRFEGYASIRIRGAMLDEVRKVDWAPRSLHRKMREVSAAIREVEITVGRDARDVEVADHMGLSLDDYHGILADASGHKVLSFEELVAGDENLSDGTTDCDGEPPDQIERRQLKEQLAETVAGLPERERLVMGLYYQEELNLREIGEVLRVSTARVCQIRSQALLRVKSRLSAWRDTD